MKIYIVYAPHLKNGRLELEAMNHQDAMLKAVKIWFLYFPSDLKRVKGQTSDPELTIMCLNDDDDGLPTYSQWRRYDY